MERLRAAGINPHEVSGTPGSGMSISGGIDTPKYQSPLAGAPEAMNNALQLALNAYQVKRTLRIRLILFNLRSLRIMLMQPGLTIRFKILCLLNWNTRRIEPRYHFISLVL